MRLLKKEGNEKAPEGDGGNNLSLHDTLNIQKVEHMSLFYNLL
jgi:hypothetical protein